MSELYELHIMRGTFVNDDPQKRCYNGAYKASHYEWSKWWVHWLSYPTYASAKLAKKIFTRADLRFKIIIRLREINV